MVRGHSRLTVPRPAPVTAYTIQQRQAHAEQAITIAAALGFLADTSCTRICETYGVPHFVNELKAMKGKLFPEFALNGDGK